MRVPETSSPQHLTAFEAKIGGLVVAIFQIQKFYVICARGIISHDLGPVADNFSKHWGGRLLLGGRGCPCECTPLIHPSLLHSLRFAILMIKYLCSIVSLSYDYYVLGHCIG
jgi:hypothetical protein